MKRFNYHAGMIASSTVLTLSVITAELIEPFKKLLGSIFSHHWIGKLVLVIAAFFIIGFFYKGDKIINKPIEYLSFYMALIYLGLIMLFYGIIYFL